MDVKIKSFGTTREVPTPVTVSNKKPKKVIEYPSLTLNSKQVKSLDELTVGQKCMIMVEAEVKGVRKPSSWEMTERGLSDKDTIAEFNLLSGSVKPKGRSYESAKKEAMESDDDE